ncbi:hypothetical protein D3C72_1879690 [compost metagenome]
MAHFCNCLRHPFCDNVFAILTTSTQAAVELILRWRQNENASGLRHLRTNLLCTLPVDIQEHIHAGCQNLLNGFTGCPVVVTEYFSVFKERISANHRSKFVVINKEIVFTVCLARTRCSRGVRNRNLRIVQRLGF